jgi:hypothetical protein
MPGLNIVAHFFKERLPCLYNQEEFILPADRSFPSKHGRQTGHDIHARGVSLLNKIIGNLQPDLFCRHCAKNYNKLFQILFFPLLDRRDKNPRQINTHGFSLREFIKYIFIA